MLIKTYMLIVTEFQLTCNNYTVLCIFKLMVLCDRITRNNSIAPLLLKYSTGKKWILFFPIQIVVLNYFAGFSSRTQLRSKDTIEAWVFSTEKYISSSSRAWRLQPCPKYMRQFLVLVWNSALREKFNFNYSTFFC